MHAGGDRQATRAQSSGEGPAWPNQTPSSPGSGARRSQV
jgi:hypothetical protein